MISIEEYLENVGDIPATCLDYQVWLDLTDDQRSAITRLFRDEAPSEDELEKARDQGYGPGYDSGLEDGKKKGKDDLLHDLEGFIEDKRRTR